MSKCFISIIIPVYNVVSFLEKAIASVFSQDFLEKEIIIVNDGSHTVAAAEIETVCSKYPGVCLITIPHAGQAMARHRGIAHARGNFILFLDADDILLPGALAHFMTILDGHSSAIAAYGRKLRINEHGHFMDFNVLPMAEDAVSGDILPALLQGIPLLSNGNVCIRKEAIEQVSFPTDMQQGEDWVTWCRLALLGDIVYAGSRPVLGIRTHAHNVSNQVLKRPVILIEMLDAVFKDPAFISHIGAEKITQYRKKHRHLISCYLHNSYMQRKQYIRALRYKALSFKAEANQPKKIRVLHVVKWFYAGGAERLLSGLLQYSDKDIYEHMILSLSDQNERLADVQNTLFIPYASIEMGRGKSKFTNYLKCFLFIKMVRPDVIKTWLPPANILGGVIGKILRVPVIWGIHDAQPVEHDAATQKQRALSVFLPTRIVCCSTAVYDTCLAGGYKNTLLEIIQNGTDTDLFTHQPEGRRTIRRELDIGDGDILIGMAAEYTPIKRHAYFLAAAQIFLASHPNARFLLCGKDTHEGNEHLKQVIRFLKLENHVHLLGIRNDMAHIYSALDVHTLISSCESFGLATTEAMACKTLCVATDVGIMRELLNDVGQVIAVCDNPHVLVDEWEQCFRLTVDEKYRRLEKGRNRIINHYSIIQTAKKYDELYQTFKTR